MSKTTEAITDFLFIGKPEEQLLQYDLVLVMGNEQIGETVDDLIFLVDRGHIKNEALIVLSGKNGSLNQGTAPEGERMFKDLTAKRSLPNKIMVENQAGNALENFKFSKPIIEQEIELVKVERMLVICKAFLTRRASMCAAACGLPTDRIDYYGTVSGKRIAPDSWHENEYATKRVLEEISRISTYTLKGDLSLD